ncbi:MAG: Gfo/Idh/MocA family oxidoreductase [Victivallaceae bacterium]|jgi:predicted dehydrogenase
MINAALIGISGFGSVHCNDLLREHRGRRLKFAAATVINQEQEAERCAVLRELGVELFSDYREMLEKHTGRIDLCCIPTGIAMHTPMAIAAMRSGANVLIEKPAAPTVQDIACMQAAEKQYKRFTAVAFQQLYRPEIMNLKRALCGGLIGDVRSISFKSVWPRNLKYYTRNNWAGRLQCGNDWVLDSPFNNAMAHHLMMACFLGGSTPERALTLRSITAELYRANRIESADTASIMAESTENIALHFCVSHASAHELPDTITVNGTQGSIIITRDMVAVENNSGRTEMEFDRDIVREQLLDAIIARAEGHDRFICSLELARVHTLLVNGVHDSSMIVPINPDCLFEETADNSQTMAVKGMNDYIEQAVMEHKMLSEVCPEYFPGCGRKIDLVDYVKFTGGKRSC